MHRYVALLWNTQSQQQTDAAQSVVHSLRTHLPTWTSAFDDDGLLVLHTDSRAGQSQVYRMEGRTGVVLGKLFVQELNEHAAPQEVALDGATARRIVDTEGRYLIDNYWGRYVAFFVDSQNKKAFALRDPSGGVRCLKTQHRGVHIYFSDIGDVCNLFSKEFSTSWNYVLGSFLVSSLVNEKTALSQVQELLTGECHKIDEASCISQLTWDPRRICLTNTIDDIDQAVSVLRSTLQSCINAWSSTYGTVIHNLSGGLDSAIVLGSLTQAPIRPELICLNYHTAAHDGDERTFARLAAERAGLQLLEMEMPSSSLRLDRLFSSMPILARPDLAIVGTPVDEMQMQIARDRGAEAFTSGEGGDHIFFQMKLEHIAADYIQAHGLNSHLLKVALETARLTKTSFWSVLRTALIHGVLRRTWDPSTKFPVKAPSFLKQEAINALPSDFIDHPWSKSVDGIGPAKSLQLYLLPKVLHRHPAFGLSDVADVVHPLFSQPLVETCLRIPIYLLTSGGGDRALARRAFANQIPHEILVRQSKGGTATYVSRMCVDNLPFLREFILDGSLAKHEMIDRQALDQVLTLSAIEVEDNLRPILKLAVTEAWLRRWSTLRHKAAA